MSNKYIKKVLKIPVDIENKINRRRHDKENWTNIYYYVDKKKVKNENNVINYDIINGACYKSDTFYKVTSISKNDNLFDYYKILKPENREPVIVKESNKKSRIYKKYNKKQLGMRIIHYPPDKPFILEF
jgi:hypothetical protein